MILAKPIFIPISFRGDSSFGMKQAKPIIMPEFPFGRGDELA
jgi:hypothetical protein